MLIQYLKYDDNVMGAGDKYDNAYFEIKYVRAYTNGTITSISPGSSTTTTTTGDKATSTTKAAGSSSAMSVLMLGPTKVWSAASVLLAGLFML